jgi:flagellar protein FliL
MSEEIKNEIIPEKKSFFNPKLLLIGLPLFTIQLVAVYFITANILLSRIHDTGNIKNPATQTSEKKEEPVKQSSSHFIYTIDDILVNPAGTNGKRFLLTSIGLDLRSEDEKKLLQSREAIVKDLIISTISAKSLDQLSEVAYRDSLKEELMAKVREIIPGVNINNVYLTKYIIQ